MKRKISFALASVMLIANMAISAFAADAKSTFTDVTDSTKYSEAVLTMAKLKIVNGYAEDNTFRPEAGIKRSEFTAVITRAMGIDNVAAGVSPFTDVAADHWAIKNIVAASNREIVNGMGDGTFHPEDNVTYEQALKMVVCAMNYKKAAENAGGWEKGAYFDQAVMLGLTKGIDAGRNDAAPRGVVAQIMYNALDIKVADADTGNTTDDTFLNKFLSMEMVQGTITGIEADVTGACDVSLALNELALLPKGEDTIVLDFEDYGEKSVLAPYLGQEVKVFYKVNAGGVDKLVILDSETTKNLTTEISYIDITEYNNGKIKYYNETGKRDDIDFDTDDITLFYNKKAVDAKDVDTKLDKWLAPSSKDFIYGNVVLTDSGADGTIDMVEIMDYDYLVALRAPSSSDYTVTNKMKFKAETDPGRVIESVILNPDKKTPVFTISDEKGASMQTTGIKANSVVLVAESEDSKSITVKVSTKTIDGEITSYTASDNEIQISGDDYYITDECVTYLAEQGTPIESGKKGKFYIDAFGNVAYAALNVNTESVVTAYLVTAAYDEDTDTGSLRVFVPGTGYRTYTMNKKVKYNNDNPGHETIVENLRLNADNFDSKDDYRNETNSNANQLIKMELENGEVISVKSINTADTPGTTTDMSGLKLYTAKPLKYKYSQNTFTTTDGATKFYTNSSTLFIYVPTDRTKTSSYAKRTVSSFDRTSAYVLDVLNVNDSKMAEVVVIYGSTAENKVVGSTPVSVLASNPADYAEGGEVTKKLELYTSNNTLVDLVVDDTYTSVAEKMQVGDIFRYVKTNEGLVGHIEEPGTDERHGIAYADIKAALEAKTYDWTDKKFYFETSYQRQDSSGLPYASAYMYNVVSVADDGASILVTQEGFTEGKPSDNTTLVQLNDSTKFVKLSDNGKKLLAKDEESEVEVTYEDLKAAEFDGEKCSKVAVIFHNGDYAKLIVIYE